MAFRKTGIDWEEIIGAGIAALLAVGIWFVVWGVTP
jgi:hypothetical protein